jgi:hypothetical protein
MTDMPNFSLDNFSVERAFFHNLRALLGARPLLRGAH